MPRNTLTNERVCLCLTRFYLSFPCSSSSFQGFWPCPQKRNLKNHVWYVLSVHAQTRPIFILCKTEEEKDKRKRHGGVSFVFVLDFAPCFLYKKTTTTTTTSAATTQTQSNPPHSISHSFHPPTTQHTLWTSPLYACVCACVCVCVCTCTCLIVCVWCIHVYKKVFVSDFAYDFPTAMELTHNDKGHKAKDKRSNLLDYWLFESARGVTYYTGLLLRHRRCKCNRKLIPNFFLKKKRSVQ